MSQAETPSALGAADDPLRLNGHGVRRAPPRNLRRKRGIREPPTSARTTRTFSVGSIRGRYAPESYATARSSPSSSVAGKGS